MRFLSVLFLFSTLFIQPVFAQPIQGTSWADVLKSKSGTLVIPYYVEDGFAFQNSKGEHTGVQLDILAQFANYLKNSKGVALTIDYKPYNDFVKLYDDVKKSSGGVIGAGNVTVTEERKKEIDFSPTYLTNISVMLSHPSVQEVGTMDDLQKKFKGFTGITQRGTTHEGYVKDMLAFLGSPNAIKYVDSEQECIEEIMKNPTMFTFVDLGAFWISKQQKKEVKHQRVGDKMSEQLAFILPKGSDWTPVLAEFFNLGSGYRANPAYRNILYKHLGSEVTSMLEMARIRQAN